MKVGSTPPQCPAVRAHWSLPPRALCRPAAWLCDALQLAKVSAQHVFVASAGMWHLPLPLAPGRKDRSANVPGHSRGRGPTLPPPRPRLVHRLLLDATTRAVLQCVAGEGVARGDVGQSPPARRAVGGVQCDPDPRDEDGARGTRDHDDDDEGEEEEDDETMQFVGLDALTPVLQSPAGEPRPRGVRGCPLWPVPHRDDGAGAGASGGDHRCRPGLPNVSVAVVRLADYTLRVDRYAAAALPDRVILPRDSS